MRMPFAERPGSRRLWARLVLVGLLGAAPLFVVSLFLVGRVYGTSIDFAAHELRGVAVHRRLERVLGAVGRYSAACARQLAGREPRELFDQAVRALDSAFDELDSDGAELGSGLASAKRDVLALEKTSASATALAEHTAKASEALVELMRRNADTSNLVLDDELGSYYLMRAVLVELPKAEQRALAAALAPATATVEAPSERQPGAERNAALMRVLDIDTIAVETKTALAQSAALGGSNAALGQRLPAALTRYSEAEERLANAFERWARNEASGAELEAGAERALGAALEFSELGANQLDVLLRSRIDVIRSKRTRAYALVGLTLVASIIAMGSVIRGLLAARESEVAKSQAELAAKEAQLRALGDNLPGGMTYQVVREPDGTMRFLYVSAGVNVLHGRTAAEVVGDPKLLYDELFEEDRALLLAAERESLEKMAPFKLVARAHRHGDGAERWFEFASAPRKLADGRVVWDGFQMDVTERHSAELASRQMQQRFTLIFDRSPIPIALVSANGGAFIAANQAFFNFARATPEQVIGRTGVELGLYARLEQRTRLLELLGTSGRVCGFEVDIQPLSGGLRQVLFWVEPLELDGERFLLAMSLDVTEQQAALRQQRELEEQLRQAQKLEALGTLAGGIAHDFNNILGAVISFAELAKLDYPNDAGLRENLDQILKASGRAAVLVRQILSFSRRQKEVRTNLQLGPIVEEALSLLRASLPTTVAIEPKLAERVPDVFANSTQVHQIVMNLCTNAAHAMKGAQGKLGVALEEVELRTGEASPHVELKPGRYVRLSVSDTGHGMDSATLARIFEPFFTTKSAGEGTGLGLSVVHGIAKEYGGAITVDSIVGKGTTFSIYLPAAAPRAATSPSAEATVPRGHGERLLLVDDEELLGNAVAKMMEHLGYVPVRFKSPNAAFAEFARDPSAFAALVTDYTMPELTGLELARSVRALRADLPVIMTSGSGDGGLERNLAGLEVSARLSKPVSYATLAQALAQALALAPKP
jgi:PAS domain S-box-containing protein